MIEFDLVPLHRVYQEIMPNIARHYTEMTDGDDYGTPDIDWELYLAVSHIHRCIVVTARDGGKLVGYAVYTLGNKPRYKEIMQAESSGIFLEKEFRAKHYRGFIKAIDDYLQKIGVKEVNYVLSDDRIGRILGCETKYKVWGKTYG